MKIGPRRSPLFLALPLAAMLAMTGCTTEELASEDPTAGSADDTVEATGSGGYIPPLMEDLPSCDEVFGILGDLTVDLVPQESDDNGPWGDPRKYGVSCAWVTDEALSGSIEDAMKTSGVAVQVVIEEDPLVESDYRDLGMIVDDPRMSELGGLLVMPGGKVDLSTDLGMVGPAVVVGPVHISLAAGGAFLGRNDEARNLTNDQAIDGAIALHRALAD